MRLLDSIERFSPRCLDLFRQACKSFVGLIAQSDNQNLVFENSHLVVLHFEVPLGPAVIATASLRSLKDAYPNVRITVVASGHSLDILKECPYIENIQSAPNPILNPLSSFFYALIHIWPYRKRYDAVVMDGGNRRTLITLFSVFTGIKRRAGYSVKPWLLHLPALDNDALSNIDINNRAFDVIAPTPLPLREPAIFFSRDDAIKFDKLIKDVDQERLRVVFVTETSAGHPNAWYGDRFVLLAQHLITHLNAHISLVGAPSHRFEIEALRDQIGFGSVSLAGLTSPRELASFMANSDFCISVDTGAMHIARSVNLPTVILGNAAQPITLWLPPADLDYIELIRKDHLPCSVCWKLTCSTRECMDEISVQDVISAFCRLRARVGWGITSRQQRVSEHISPHRPSRDQAKS